MTRRMISVAALCCLFVVEGFAGETFQESPGGLQVQILPSVGSQFFVDFSFNFLTWVGQWWKKDGRDKLIGEWVIFVREYPADRPHGGATISVSFAKDEEKDATWSVAELPPEKQIDAPLNALLLAQRTIKALEQASSEILSGQQKPGPKTRKGGKYL